MSVFDTDSLTGVIEMSEHLMPYLAQPIKRSTVALIVPQVRLLECCCGASVFFVEVN